MPLALPLLLGAAKGAVGIAQMISGNHLAKNNIRPTYHGADIWKHLLTVMQGQAQFGIDQNSLSFADNSNKDALAGSIDALLKAGGDPNSIAGIYDAYTAATQKLTMADSDRRWAKIQSIADVTGQLANAQKDEFLYNEDAKFKDTAQLAAQKQKNGLSMLFGGLDTIGGALGANQTANLFGDNNTGGQANNSGKSGVASKSPDTSGLTIEDLMKMLNGDNTVTLK